MPLRLKLLILTLYGSSAAFAGCVLWTVAEVISRY